VFSSWNEVLDILCFALRKNSLPFVRYGGSTRAKREESLRAFLLNPDIRVLVCNLHHAGRGLTLTVANHVVLLEPQLSAADEEQAVGRIYRMGQRRQSHVWRYFIADTIERRIKDFTSTPAAAASGGNDEPTGGDEDDNGGMTMTRRRMSVSKKGVGAAGSQAAQNPARHLKQQWFTYEDLEMLFGHNDVGPLMPPPEELPCSSSSSSAAAAAAAAAPPPLPAAANPFSSTGMQEVDGRRVVGRDEESEEEGDTPLQPGGSAALWEPDCEYGDDLLMMMGG